MRLVSHAPRPHQEQYILSVMVEKLCLISVACCEIRVVPFWTSWQTRLPSDCYVLLNNAYTIDGNDWVIGSHLYNLCSTSIAGEKLKTLTQMLMEKTGGYNSVHSVDNRQRKRHVACALLMTIGLGPSGAGQTRDKQRFPPTGFQIASPVLQLLAVKFRRYRSLASRWCVTLPNVFISSPVCQLPLTPCPFP